MKKRRIVGLVLAFCAFTSFVACGKDDNKAGDDGGHVEKGETISSAQAQELFAGIEAKSKTISVETLDKFAYTTVMTMDEQVMSVHYRYSKEDMYAYSYNTEENMKISTEEGEHVRTTVSRRDNTYHYVDEDGRLISATDRYHLEEVKNEETGIFEPRTEEWKQYTVKEVDPVESANKFYNSEDDFADFLSQSMTYTSSMLSTFKPLLQSGAGSSYGMKMEVRSKGDGHLWICQDMTSVSGMYMEYEFTDYALSYMKIVMDYEQMGMTAAPCKVMIEEVFFTYNECELIYPNLSEYALQD